MFIYPSNMQDAALLSAPAPSLVKPRITKCCRDLWLPALAVCFSPAFSAATPVHLRSPRVDPIAHVPPAMVVQAVDAGYQVTGSGFTMLLTKNGSVKDVACHGRPLFERAYLEVRDKTWHVKLYPRDEQVKSFPPQLDRDNQKFLYAIQLDDPGTGIRATVDESVSISPRGEMRVALNVTPQARFEAHRISWNIEFPASQLVDTACTWQSGKAAQSTLRFPQQQSTDPHLAKGFDWIRLNLGEGPVDFRFEASDNKKMPVPIDNILEDLRWWNKPNFWIASSAPYPHEDGDPDKPFQADPGDTRTLRVTMLLHCGERN